MNKKDYKIVTKLFCSSWVQLFNNSQNWFSYLKENQLQPSVALQDLRHSISFRVFRPSMCWLLIRSSWSKKWLHVEIIKKMFRDKTMAQGQEVEFHEIEIGDQIILPVFMKSRLQFFMRSNFWSLDRMANSSLNLTSPNLT